MGPPTGGHDERIMAVYRDTIAGLYRYVSSHCGGDRALAEDVTQETWLRAVRDWRAKGPPDEPMAWLVTVARNLLTSYYRRRRPASIDAVSAADVLAAAVQADRAQRELLLGRARVEELRRLVSVGTAFQLDLKKAEVEVLERELELRQITQELQTLAAVKR